jgi:hypothetical protein
MAIGRVVWKESWAGGSGEGGEENTPESKAQQEEREERVGLEVQLMYGSFVFEGSVGHGGVHGSSGKNSRWEEVRQLQRQLRRQQELAQQRGFQWRANKTSFRPFRYKLTVLKGRSFEHAYNGGNGSDGNGFDDNGFGGQTANILPGFGFVVPVPEAAACSAMWVRVGYTNMTSQFTREFKLR